MEPKGTYGVQLKMKPWRLDQRGQLVIPALFVIPSLVLFIYLIYETAKLSAEKIKHQFALDTAVFVEMTNYSDFLNRTAYVNGPFPARVCYEAFNDKELVINHDEDYPSAKDTNLYEYLVSAGLCPYSTKCKDPSSCAELAMQGADDWGFTYGDGTKCSNGENCTVGRSSKEPDVKPDIILFSDRFARTHHLYDPMVQFLIQNYNIIFSLLGIVEDSQIAVFDRLTKGSHYFYNRAYTMNAPGERATSMSQLPNLTAKPQRTATADSYVKKLSSEGDSYVTVNYKPFPMPLLVLTTVGGLDGKQAIAPRELRQNWRPDPNYFKVDGNSLLGFSPFVHATVEVSGGTIWPGATPRYQVRIYP